MVKTDNIENTSDHNVNEKIAFYKRPRVAAYQDAVVQLHQNPSSSYAASETQSPAVLHSTPTKVTRGKEECTRGEHNNHKTHHQSISSLLKSLCTCTPNRKLKVKLLLKALASGILWSAFFTLLYWCIGMAIGGWFVWVSALKYICLCHESIPHFMEYGTVSGSMVAAGRGGVSLSEEYLNNQIDVDHSRDVSSHATLNIVDVIHFGNFSDLDLMHRINHNDTSQCINETSQIDTNSLTGLFDIQWERHQSCKNCQMTDFFFMTFFTLLLFGGSFGYFLIWITKCFRFTKEDYSKFCGMVNFNPEKQRRKIEKLRCVTDITGHQEAHPITSLVQRTWVYTERLGKDSRALKHKGVRVKGVLKVKNKPLWKEYRKGHAKTDTSGALPEEMRQNPILTMETDTTNTASHGELEVLLGNCSLNLDHGEVYLFHGTKLENIPSIVTHGFDINCARSGLYGRAIYLAENSEKADQYTDYRSNRRDKDLAMLVVRVTLGRMMCHLEEKKFKMAKTRSLLLLTKPKYDTVVAGIRKRFREFLVFSEKKLYPEFVVIYDRTT